MRKRTAPQSAIQFFVSPSERREIFDAARNLDLTPSAWLRSLALSEARKIQVDHDRWHALTPKDFRAVVMAGLGISTQADRERVLASLGIAERKGPTRRPPTATKKPSFGKQPS